MISRPIRTKADYRRAVDMLEAQTEKADTIEGRLYEVLADMAEAYDDRVNPIPASDPIAHIEHRVDAMGMTSKDLEGVIGDRSGVWRILNRRRALTLDMIRALEKLLGCDPAVLVRPYALEKEAS